MKKKVKQLLEALLEAVKEPLRLLALSVIPVLITYLTELGYEWAFYLTVGLRFIDKLLHELGKTTKNEKLAKGITRF